MFLNILLFNTFVGNSLGFLNVTVFLWVSDIVNNESLRKNLSIISLLCNYYITTNIVKCISKYFVQKTIITNVK